MSYPQLCGGRLMDWKIIALGCVGGAIPDAIRFINNRYSVELPEHYASVNFWVGFLLLVILGGAAAWLGGAKEVQAALAYGFAAPEIISRSLSSGPITLSKPSSIIRRWWSF